MTQLPEPVARERGVTIYAEYLTAIQDAKRTLKRKRRELAKVCPHSYTPMCKPDNGYARCAFCDHLKEPTTTPPDRAEGEK